jgi:hypothetical protein
LEATTLQPETIRYVLGLEIITHLAMVHFVLASNPTRATITALRLDNLIRHLEIDQ